MTPIEQAVGGMWTGNADPQTVRLAGHAMIAGTMRVDVRCQTDIASWCWRQEAAEVRSMDGDRVCLPCRFHLQATAGAAFCRGRACSVIGLADAS